MIVIKNYPNSDYAIDSKYKLELIVEIMASKEMYLARYYIQREKWVPAINRFKVVINQYDQQYMLKKLFSISGIHFKLGLENEAKNMRLYLDITINLVSGMKLVIKF